MAVAPNTVALPGIVALPPTTARQIGSGQVLVDPSSVVKELIDNALDARAKSIFVDIASSTIDSIQVKDDGHGIPSEDRPLVCRRYCTSKIRDMNDLRDAGGKWLGFRGEALSSMAEMSSALMVTTRVEGEPVAVKLKYGRDGELASTERDSHPVGTTVKVTSFFEYIPVRKQVAIKNAAKCLVKIRRLIQAYALARPGIRFRLRVLKVKNNAGDFIYAPKADASIEDAVLKIFGKDCAMQCCSAVGEADGFEIHAFLPKPTAVGSKISNYSSFVSIDARPVSSHRGTIKQLVRACKDRLGQVNASLVSVRDPFFCLNITCPPGSYDANIEPAKDDVLFENSDAVLKALDKLLKSYYSESIANINSYEPSLSALQSHETEPDEVLVQNEDNILPHVHNIDDRNKTTDATTQPRWRSSMYGIDEDDLEFLQDDRTPIIDEEEGRRAIGVSNPWTIARMNATIKPRQAVTNGQLPSPAKSTTDLNGHSSPFKIPTTPSRVITEEPLTPQTSLKTNATKSQLDDELERSIQRLSQPVSVTRRVDGWSIERRRDPLSGDRSSDSLEAVLSGSVSPSKTQASDFWASSLARHGNIDSGTSSLADRVIRDQQPMRAPKLSKPATRQKKTKDPELAYSQTGASSRSQEVLPVATAQTGESRLYSNNNKDIRDCFGLRSEVQERNLVQERSFTPINRPIQSVQTRPLSLLAPDRHCPILQNERNALRPDPARPRNMREYLQAYSERAGARPSSPTENQMSMQFDQRPAARARQFSVHNSDVAASPEAGHPLLAFSPGSAPLVPLHTPRTNLRSQSTDKMTAFFQSHLGNIPSHPSHHHPHTKKPHYSSHHNLAAKTLDSGLPSHNLAISVSIAKTVEDITRHALARHNYLPEWDCAAEDAYNSFSEHIPEERIVVWVCKLEVMLCALYERADGVHETGDVLEEAVKRGLGEKREGFDAGYGGGDEEGRGDVVIVADDECEDEDEDEIEEEMLMDM